MTTQSNETPYKEWQYVHFTLLLILLLANVIKTIRHKTTIINILCINSFVILKAKIKLPTFFLKFNYIRYQYHAYPLSSLDTNKTCYCQN